jgi:Ca2+-transporting ATPase
MTLSPSHAQETGIKSSRPLDAALLSKQEIAREFVVDIDLGLTSSEAALRLSADGRNELAATAVLPAWRRVLAHFQDPLIYLLCAAVLISLVAWTVEGHTSWPADAIVIALVILLNGVLGFLQRQRHVTRLRPCPK